MNEIRSEHRLVIDGQERRVQISSGDERTFRVRIFDGDRLLDELQLELRVSAQGQLLVQDQQVTPVHVEARAISDAGQELAIHRRGLEPAIVRILDEQHLARRAIQKSGSSHAGATVTAPMPGKVVKCLVRVGDEVAIGQGLVIVEAMKMENELRAAVAGVVQVVNPREGQPVEAGEVLVVIAPAKRD